jgi:hypothetical protein
MFTLHSVFVDNQLSSVQRQLNLYGFKCISRGEDKGAFFHANFKRGDWETVRKITRYIPVKKAFPNDGFSDRKPSGDDDYVFHDGSYQNSNTVHDNGDGGSFSSGQNNYYNEPDSFALFQSKSGDAVDVKSSDLEWTNYSQMTKKPDEEDKKLQRPKVSPPAPSMFKPSILTSRLGYKFPSVSQMTASSAAGAQPIRDFIIITNNIVRIDPDYDLADCLNCTYDFDVGRHSVNSGSAPQTHLPSIPAALQIVSVSENANAHTSSTKSTPANALHSYQSVEERVTEFHVDYNNRLERANSMDDFVELCAGLDE